MSINSDHIGLALKAVRKDVGITVDTVYKELLIEPSTLHAIEIGVTPPSMNLFLELAKFYEVDGYIILYLAEAIADPDTFDWAEFCINHYNLDELRKQL